MLPRMTASERDLFICFLKHSHIYTEFGAGGSTFMASKFVSGKIVSVESSREWVAKVNDACADSAVKPTILHVDIGSTGVLGYPSDPSTKEKWSAYYENLWELPETRQADLYLIDGRFRVACFAQVVLNCPPGAIIGLHDFASRKLYHPVRQIAREIASAEDISFFQPYQNVRRQARRLVEDYRHNPH